MWAKMDSHPDLLRAPWSMGCRVASLSQETEAVSEAVSLGWGLGWRSRLPAGQGVEPPKQEAMSRKPPGLPQILSCPCRRSIRTCGEGRGRWSGRTAGRGPAGRPTQLRGGVSTAQGWRQFEFNSHHFGWI